MHWGKDFELLLLKVKITAILFKLTYYIRRLKFESKRSIRYAGTIHGKKFWQFLKVLAKFTVGLNDVWKILIIANIISTTSHL